MNKYLIYYLIIINVITFITYALDKRYAIKKKERISENTLLSLSIIGGSIGGLLSMYLFHHKTKKFKFKFINILFSIILIGYIIKKISNI